MNTVVILDDLKHLRHAQTQISLETKTLKSLSRKVSASRSQPQVLSRPVGGLSLHAFLAMSAASKMQSDWVSTFTSVISVKLTAYGSWPCLLTKPD